MAKDNTLSEDEIIAQAIEAFGQENVVEGIANPGMLLAALEAFYMSGSADELNGDADTFGHFYRVHRWIVWTDSQGFRDVETYDNEDEARQAYSAYETEYVSEHCNVEV